MIVQVPVPVLFSVRLIPAPNALISETPVALPLADPVRVSWLFWVPAIESDLKPIAPSVRLAVFALMVFVLLKNTWIALERDCGFELLVAIAVTPWVSWIWFPLMV